MITVVYLYYISLLQTSNAEFSYLPSEFVLSRTSITFLKFLEFITYYCIEGDFKL